MDKLAKLKFAIEQIRTARLELAADNKAAEMNMSQAIKLEPCKLLDELRLEHKILSRDIDLLSGERLEARRIVLKSIKDHIQALETVR